MYKFLILIFLSTSLFANSKKSLLIPLYSHPTKWVEFKKQFEYLKANDINTYAIINPYNGPSDKKDEFYIDGINFLKKYNIKLLGYVYTGFAKRNEYEVRKDIKKWSKFYKDLGVKGIFFDETTVLEKDSSLYKDYILYSKKQGFNFNVLNPGYTTHKSFMNIGASVIVSYENSYQNWKRLFPKVVNKKNDTTKLSLLLHEVSKKGFKEVMSSSKTKGFDYVYLTNDTLPNPWDDLPKSFSWYVE